VDCSLRSALGNSLQTPISKITRDKWTGGVARVVQCLLFKNEFLSSNPNSTKKKKVLRGEYYIRSCKLIVTNKKPHL
jgi:hypothetical protein